MRTPPRRRGGSRPARVAWYAALAALAVLLAGAAAPQPEGHGGAQPAGAFAAPHMTAVFDAFFAGRDTGTA